MHLQMNISSEVEARLEQLVKELRLEHLKQEIELKKLLHKCTADGRKEDLATYQVRNKTHRAQGARLTVTNMLRVVLALGLRHPDVKQANRLLDVLNKVGVAKGYGNGKA